MSIQLKIKAKTLAAEARIIKDEQAKLRHKANKACDTMCPILGLNYPNYLLNKDFPARLRERLSAGGNDPSTALLMKLQARRVKANDGFQNLRNHRTDIVRKASRNVHLARAFLHGWKYEEVEKDAKSQPNWTEIMNMVRRYRTPYHQPVDTLENWLAGAQKTIWENRNKGLQKKAA